MLLKMVIEILAMRTYFKYKNLYFPSNFLHEVKLDDE